MRKAIMIAGLVLAFGVLAPATALGKAGGTDRPISVHQSGTTVVDVGTLAFTTETTGIVSHMGKSTAEIEGVITLTGPDTFTIAGSAVIVAANGDELFGTFTGSGTNTPGGGSEGTVDVTYSGGTGRFTNASGTASGPFTQTPTGTTATFATDISQSGTISY
jgi:hypothetical protein